MMKVAKNSLETVLNAPKKDGHLAGWPSAMIGALQLLYSVSKCAWIAPYIPKVSNFNMVVLNKIPALHHVLHVQEYNFAIWGQCFAILGHIYDIKDISL